MKPHSASKNYLRIPRFITNPPVTLKAPLNLNREDPQEYVREFCFIAFPNFNKNINTIKLLVLNRARDTTYS